MEEVHSYDATPLQSFSIQDLDLHSFRHFLREIRQEREERIEILTPGRSPNGVDADAMLAGAHVVRNPWIYARFSDAGLVTRAGTGIRRIARLVREATGREIGLRVSESEVQLTIPRKPLA
jgi:predicted HTH transcriptional regulator